MMSGEDYKSMVQNIRALKKLGQHFLLNEQVAKVEARYASGKRVVEMGPGLGILTRELCAVAKNVTAVERDPRLYEMLAESLSAGNLKLISSDFFDLEYGALGNPEIMVSNIPYNLSSKTIGWLAEHGMEAVLCLQKEFVEHMLAEPDTRDYSRLSVITHLQFDVSNVIDVPQSDFYPPPNVDSKVVHIKPNSKLLTHSELYIITSIMSHKKKKVRNSIMDAEKALGLSKEDAYRLADSVPSSGERLFKLEPIKIMEIAKSIDGFKKGSIF